MLKVTQGIADKIDASIRSIFQHLQSHSEWAAVTAIENQSVVARQDDERVGLLLEKGIREVVEAKHELSMVCEVQLILNQTSAKRSAATNSTTSSESAASLRWSPNSSRRRRAEMTRARPRT